MKPSSRLALLLALASAPTFAVEEAAEAAPGETDAAHTRLVVGRVVKDEPRVLKAGTAAVRVLDVVDRYGRQGTLVPRADRPLPAGLGVGSYGVFWVAGRPQGDEPGPGDARLQFHRPRGTMAPGMLSIGDPGDAPGEIAKDIARSMTSSTDRVTVVLVTPHEVVVRNRNNREWSIEVSGASLAVVGQSGAFVMRAPDQGGGLLAFVDDSLEMKLVSGGHVDSVRGVLREVKPPTDGGEVVLVIEGADGKRTSHRAIGLVPPETVGQPIRVLRFSGPDGQPNARHVFVQTDGKLETLAGLPCFLTTAIATARGLPDDCEELTLLRALRDGPLRGHPDVQAYDAIAPRIVERVEASVYADRIWSVLYQDHLRPLLAQARAGDVVGAHRAYRAMVFELCDGLFPKGLAVADPHEGGRHVAHLGAAAGDAGEPRLEVGLEVARRR